MLTSVFFAVASVLISKPPGPARVAGDWYYDEPATTLSGVPTNQALGQYLYVSQPSVQATCARNLTIHIGGSTFWSCTTRNGYAQKEYYDSHECIPDALMMPAFIVDRINERSILDIPNTCLQLSVNHYDYLYAGQTEFTLDITTAVRRSPTKHAIVSSVHADNTYYMATAAKMSNLPIIDGNWLAGDSIRHSDEVNFPTLFRTISDVRAALPGLLELLPDTFAFLTDDGPNSASQTAAILALVEASGKSIAFTATIPEYQSERPQVTMAPMEDFVSRLRRETIRHVLIAAGSFTQPFLACAIKRAGIDPKNVQAVVVGGAVVEIARQVVVDPFANGNVTANDYSVIGDSYCTQQEVYDTAENGGWIGMQPCTASTYAEDDVLVNRVLRSKGIPAGLSPGARALDGSTWTAAQTLIVAPTATCVDDDGAVNSNTLLRKLANQAGTITCQSVLPFGQSLRYSMINLLATYCPISMCGYNRYAAACRISCACADASLKTTTGEALCTTFSSLPRGYNIIKPFALTEFRCDGEDCRKLPYYATPLAFWNMGMEYTFGNQSGADGYASAQFGRYGQYTLGYLGRGAPSKYIGMTLSDSIWGLALTYRCGYDRHGEAWLQRLADWQYDDVELWEQTKACLTDPSAVQYAGTHGHINFAYFRSPEPGFTVNTLNQPALSEGRGVHTSGQVVPGVGDIVSSRVFGRDDHSQCPDITGDFSPLQICPNGTDLTQDEYDTPASLAAKMPLPHASVCGPGLFPISEFEPSLGRLDACAECPEGTYKTGTSSDRCAPCDAGYYCPGTGATQRNVCPLHSITPTSSTLQLQGVPTALQTALWTQSIAGFTQCLDCPPFSVTESVGSSQCKCMLSYYLLNGACTRCPSDMVTTDLVLIENVTNPSQCVCARGKYAGDDGRCKSCPAMQETTIEGATSIDQCEVQGWAVGVLVGSLMGVLVIGLLVFCMYRRVKHLEREHLGMRKEKVASAMQDTAEFAYPMVLMLLSDFKQLGKLQSHETIREDGSSKRLLKLLDSTKMAQDFLAKEHNILFFSHQWVCWTHPDPENKQYELMKASADLLVEQLGWDTDRTYVWADYLSVPQASPKTQKLAIDSLCTYAFMSSAFVIVAPTLLHANTGDICDAASYNRRTWCRAEQLAYFVSHGLARMYLADGKSSTEPLRAIDKEWVRVGVNVFDAELTCCRRQHQGMELCDKEKLVEPVIGLFAAMYSARQEPNFKEAYELCMMVPDMFPKDFNFVQKHGDGKVRTTRRKLFGPLIDVCKKCIDSGETTHAKARGVLVADTASVSTEVTMSQLLHKSSSTSAVHGSDPALHTAAIPKNERKYKVHPMDEVKQEEDP